jgi:hypothetical protein
MAFRKNLDYLGTLSLALCVEFLTVSVLMLPLRAQSLKISLTFPPPTERGAPARTVGAGQRSVEEVCVKGRTPLAALTPSNNVGTTVSANPTLFWYVSQTKAKSAEFELLDDRGNQVYVTTLALNGTPGVVKLSLPQTVSLQKGKHYDWRFSLVCDPENPGGGPFVQGWLERTELSSAQKNKLARTKDPLKRAEVYAKAGVWQETVAIVAKLHYDRPNDSKITEAWKELLKSVDLEAIANASVVNCCTADK